MKIILASQSLFRKHALEVLGLKYETIPSHIDESAIRHENPHMLAEMLAKAKALKVGENPDAIIISADLFVVFRNKIIEKPHDLEEAKEMLKSFSGNSFDIIAGLAVYNSRTKKMLSTAESCKVKFRELSQYEIDDYVARYPVLKCSAAFESDGLLRFAEHIEGDYVFRAGLPVDKLIEFLRENDVKV